MVEWNDAVAAVIEKRIEVIEKRIGAIEKKQAERFPHLIDTLNKLDKKISTTFKISCKRLDFLENRQNPDMYNEKE